MIRVATPAEMREADRLAIESRGVPSLSLMERAGQGAADEIRRRLRGVEGSRVVVASGKGNNGGDGFVVARYLRAWGADVRVFSTAPGRDAYEGDARANLDRLLDEGDTVVFLEPSGLGVLCEAIRGAHVVVDALLGTGFTGAVRAPLDRVIEAINDGAFIVALDVPSGVDGLTGAVGSIAVRAHLTVTFAAPKIGSILYPGRLYAREIHTVDIGIADDVLDEAGVSTGVTTSAEARALLPRRAPDAHKGSAGRVLVIGGSVGMTGAVTLSSRAALRAGAGLVTAAVPSSLNDILEVKLTEVMTLPCHETSLRTFAEDAGEAVIRFARGVDAVAIGPGLSLVRETVAFAQEIGLTAPVPTVIDADALNAFQGEVEALAQADGPRVLTPHPGEAARLLGERTATVRAHPAATCREIAEKARAVVLLKGAPSLLCDGSREAGSRLPIVINPTGNAGLATAGSGDVLTGIIAAFLGQGLAPFDAARLGAFVHAAAGDIGADRLTEWSLMAGDLVELLPETLALLDAGEEFVPWMS